MGSARPVTPSVSGRCTIISSPDYRERREELYRRLEEDDSEGYYTDALLNLRYLTGFNGTAGSLLLIGGGSSPSAVLFVDGRYRHYAAGLAASDDLSVEDVEDDRLDELDTVLEDRSVDSVHFEKDRLSYATFVSLKNSVTYPENRTYGDDWVENQRRRKSSQEIEAIEEAIDLTLEVFALIETWLEPGLSEKGLSRAIRGELESRSEGLAFDPLVLIGENTANPHCPASHRELTDEDALLVDMGLTINGYCSDLTRMFFMDSVDEQHEELYELSKESAAEAYDVIEPGKTVGDVAGRAHDVIRDAGYEENLRHGLGHAVGLNVHESPSLSESGDTTLETGMVVTLEPGIYIDGFGGGRIEHMVLVTDEGTRLLDEPDDIMRQEFDLDGHDE